MSAEEKLENMGKQTTEQKKADTERVQLGEKPGDSLGHGAPRFLCKGVDGECSRLASLEWRLSTQSHNSNMKTAMGDVWIKAHGSVSREL